MSRITERDERGNAQIVEYYNIKEATDKLAAYEDMGIPAIDTGVLTNALTTYGGDTQVDMMIEEMSELTKALLKLRRKRHSGIDYFKPEKNDVIKEMADVYIVLLQMIQLSGEPDLLDAYVQDKIQRLRVRLFADGKKEAENTVPWYLKIFDNKHVEAVAKMLENTDKNTERQNETNS